MDVGLHVAGVAIRGASLRGAWQLKAKRPISMQLRVADAPAIGLSLLPR